MDGNPKALVASVNPNQSQLAPQTTFFYEQPSGNIIAVGELEAFTIHRKYKQVGVSDGLVFQQAAKAAQKLLKETGDLPKAQELIRQGEQDEIALARGHLQVPRNFSYTNRNGQPIDKRGDVVPPFRRT